MKTAIFTIGYQNDFVLNAGSVSVTGGKDCLTKFCDFLQAFNDRIDGIYSCFETRPYYQSSHTSFWLCPDPQDGGKLKEPSANTIINSQNDILEGKFVPSQAKFRSKIKEEFVSFPLALTAPFCFRGDFGWCTPTILQNCYNHWETFENNRVCYLDLESTDLIENTRVFQPLYNSLSLTILREEISKYSRIVVAGLSHNKRLENSVDSMIMNGIKPKNIKILVECCSGLDKNWVESAKEKGVKFLEGYKIFNKKSQKKMDGLDKTDQT